MSPGEDLEEERTLEEQRRAVMDKYKAQASAVPTEKNRKLWAWAESVHLGARALSGERIWWA